MTGLTVPVTTPVSSPPLPSVITYGNSTGPVYSGSGLKLTVPSGATLTVPFSTGMVCSTPGVSGVPLMDVIVTGSASGSVSPSKRSRGIGAEFSLTVNVSSSATGGLLEPLTVITNSAVSVPPLPSLRV